MRYVKHEKPVATVDPISGKPVEEVDADGKRAPQIFTMERAVRIAAAIAAQKGAADAQVLRDVVKRFQETKEGEYGAYPDEEWAALEPEFKRPNASVFGIAWVFSGESHQRAWLKAPTEKPVSE